MKPEEREVARQAVWLAAAVAYIHGASSSGGGASAIKTDVSKIANGAVSAYDSAFPPKEVS